MSKEKTKSYFKPHVINDTNKELEISANTTPLCGNIADVLNRINGISAMMTAFLGLIIGIFGIVNLFVNLSCGNSLHMSGILILSVCAVFFALSLIFTAVLKRSVKPIFAYTLYAAFLLCHAVLSYAGFADVKAFCFYAAVVFCSCLFCFKPKIHIPLIIAAFTVYYVFICITDAEKTVNTPVCICMCAVCVFCAVLKYTAVTRSTSDISALADENLRLKAMVGYDYLTDAKNRFALEHDKPSYLNKPVCVIMCDIDCFKLFNDTYGHQTGDRVIVKAAEILKESFGREHTYRYGGDEFLIISQDVNCEQSLEHIRDAISDIQIEDINRPIEFSFGVTSGNAADSDELDKLIYNADKLLYENKRNSKS